VNTNVAYSQDTQIKDGAPTPSCDSDYLSDQVKERASTVRNYTGMEGRDMTEEIEGIPLVPEPSAERLDERRQSDYREHREALIEWLLLFGKNPDKAEGYATRTVLNTAQRLDIFYRWVWDERGGYTTSIDHDDADAYMRHLVRKEEGDYSRNNTQSAIKRLFKWRLHQRGGELWEPEIIFTEPSGSAAPRDFLLKEERQQIREAALEYGSIPSYSGVTARERDKWKTYLAQRFQKPRSRETTGNERIVGNSQVWSGFHSTLDSDLSRLSERKSRGLILRTRYSESRKRRAVRTSETGPSVFESKLRTPSNAGSKSENTATDTMGVMRSG
jgi:hypothetical protein